MMKAFKDIDSYIKSFPPKIQKELKAIRRTVKMVAPRAVEKISYGIPTFHLHRALVHFAAFRTHISFFPTSSGVEAFKKELKKYETSRGTIRFTLDVPVPLALIKKITKFRVQEETQKAKKRR